MTAILLGIIAGAILGWALTWSFARRGTRTLCAYYDGKIHEYAEALRAKEKGLMLRETATNVLQKKLESYERTMTTAAAVFRYISQTPATVNMAAVMKMKPPSEPKKFGGAAGSPPTNGVQ